MEAPEGGVAGACRKCGHTTECDMHHQKECEKPRMKNVYGPISGLWAWYRYSKDKRAYQVGPHTRRYSLRKLLTATSRCRRRRRPGLRRAPRLTTDRRAPVVSDPLADACWATRPPSGHRIMPLQVILVASSSIPVRTTSAPARELRTRFATAPPLVFALLADFPVDVASAMAVACRSRTQASVCEDAAPTRASTAAASQRPHRQSAGAVHLA